MTTINPLQRSVHEVLETNLPWQNSFDRVNVKKAYQYVKYVTDGKPSRKYKINPATGKRYCIPGILFDHSDYEVTCSRWYEYDTVTIRGSKGFIRLALKPLFEIV